MIAERKVMVDGYMTSKHQHMPPNAMSHLRAITQSRPMNTGVMVLVGANSMMKNMIMTFMNIYNNMLQRETPLAFAETVEEAYKIIQQKKAARISKVNS
jgi:Ni,Fe-hydrogenase I large subunit